MLNLETFPPPPFRVLPPSEYRVYCGYDSWIYRQVRKVGEFGKNLLSRIYTLYILGNNRQFQKLSVERKIVARISNFCRDSFHYSREDRQRRKEAAINLLLPPLDGAIFAKIVRTRRTQHRFRRDFCESGGESAANDERSSGQRLMRRAGLQYKFAFTLFITRVFYRVPVTRSHGQIQGANDKSYGSRPGHP